MINQCIYLSLTIKIICNSVSNDTCVNCSNKNHNYNLKTIFIVIGCFLGILLFIFLLILFYKKFLSLFSNNINIQSESNLNNDKLMKKKLYYLINYELKKEIYQKEDESEECSICLENIKMNDNIIVLPCKHIFHFNCIILFVLRKIDTHCPLCKYDILTLLEGKEIDFDNIKINFEKEKKMLQNYKNLNNIEPIVIHIQSNNNVTSNSFAE